MDGLSEQRIYCPYCGESIDVFIDAAELGDEYIEDCQVCCRPIIFSPTQAADGSVTVTVRAENDTY
ncbi:CPXCG motif-containing cysteine-rich protein [Halioxenophilus sp. WMMB6]|uniref:CPXCG motif-containing cysteine-rich protein n=1 Tax=Halioxenophilus sp. WMMB6 TaxID=3073815 RepID=UPI00295EF3E1|nr:CPXCG motif-containing cysteine-rich protein [Halioxenophilus sp. WMMB6]